MLILKIYKKHYIIIFFIKKLWHAQSRPKKINAKLRVDKPIKGQKGSSAPSALNYSMPAIFPFAITLLKSYCILLPPTFEDQREKKPSIQ